MHCRTAPCDRAIRGSYIPPKAQINGLHEEVEVSGECHDNWEAGAEPKLQAGLLVNQQGANCATACDYSLAVSFTFWSVRTWRRWAVVRLERLERPHRPRLPRPVQQRLQPLLRVRRRPASSPSTLSGSPRRCAVLAGHDRYRVETARLRIHSHVSLHSTARGRVREARVPRGHHLCEDYERFARTRARCRTRLDVDRSAARSGVVGHTCL